jgi:ketosteroid isomerase-like protein
MTWPARIGFGARDVAPRASGTYPAFVARFRRFAVSPQPSEHDATRDTQRAMPEESTTPDVADLVRSFWDWSTDRDWDAILAFYAADAVWDMTPVGLGTYDDAVAMRGLWDDWVSSNEELALDVDARDLGGGVVLAIVDQNARPVGSTAHVQAHQALVYLWEHGTVTRVTVYTDIDEARADAERLAEERG